MSNKFRVVHEFELAYKNPPVPYVEWIEPAVRRFLAQRGFDLHRPISKVLDQDGWSWVQRK